MLTKEHAIAKEPEMEYDIIVSVVDFHYLQPLSLTKIVDLSLRTCGSSDTELDVSVEVSCHHL